MFEFRQIKRLKTIASSIVVAKYTLWCLFFILQGEAISLSITKDRVYEQLIYSLLALILVKVIVMFCDIFDKFIRELFKNHEIYIQWGKLFPKKIYRDNERNQHEISILFFDYLPKLFELEISIFSNWITLIYIFSITVAAFVYTRFYIGIIALLVVFLLNYFTKNFFLKNIDEFQRSADNSKIKILAWVDDYFSSYREVSKNWFNTESWSTNIYHAYYTAKKNQNYSYLWRDILNQISVEIPFLLNTSVVIVAVYYDYISLTQMFVWIGFSQFMINASNSVLSNRVDVKQQISLMKKGSEILELFTEYHVNNSQNIWKTNAVSEITMTDGTRNYLAAEPGVYHIKGRNGAGKSTLLNHILGYERIFKAEYFSNLNEEFYYFNHRDIRLIERQAVIFESLSDFSGQVYGPFNANEFIWKNKVSSSMIKLLGEGLSKEWMKVFISLESNFINRKDKLFSSGEKIILSFIRFFASWDCSVKLLVVDECDSFLDEVNRKLFIKAIDCLSLHMAVYISSHDHKVGFLQQG